VANKNEGLLNSLDIDVIKSINGQFEADEIIQTFSNFFFNRMFIDITAIQNYNDISNIQKLSMSLEMDKVIFLLDNILMNDNIYLSKLISMGIYNFANTKDSLLYLYNHPNTYKDVAHIHQLNANTNTNTNTQSDDKKNRFFKTNSMPVDTPVTPSSRNAKIIGFKAMTSGAGATTLVYMLKKYLSEKHYVVALEVNKNDFGFFNEKDMYSINQNNLNAAISKFSNASYILVDINNGNLTSCDEIIYLIEPSTIKLNKMMLINKNTFEKLYGKKIVLNKSLLKPKDVLEFEHESQSTITFNIPPLNDREINGEIMQEFIEKIEL
jgi:hypothetical protein